MTCKKRIVYNTDINYRATAAVLAKDDNYYISSCNNNISNNPIDCKTYIKDEVEYLYWYPLDDL